MRERRQSAVRRAGRVAVERLERRTFLSVHLEAEDWWVVTADHNRGQHIRLELVPGQTTNVRAIIDGKVAGTIRLADAEDPWIDLVGGAGDDRIEIGDGIPITIGAYGGNGDDTIIGSAAADDLGGGSGNDLILGGAGDDDLDGSDGDDTLNGGDGDDDVFGNLGDDLIRGDGGRDTLQGREGADTIEGAAADGDRVMGGFGRDTVRGMKDAWTSYEDGDWQIEGDFDPDAPDDRILVEPDPDDRAKLRAVVNGRVIDRVPVEGLRAIYVDGGAGDDSIAYRLGKIGIDILAVASGGPGDDRIVGGPEANDFSGNGGNDTIDGGSGQDDELYGDGGDDHVTPKDDDDFHEEDNTSVELDEGILYVWTGLDDPVRGSDFIVRLDPKDADVIQVLVDGKVFGTVRAADVTELSVEGSDLDDRITIELPAETGILIEAFGDEGDDTIIGSAGADELDGGPGDDSIRGNGGGDILYGDAGRDVLDGGDGDDQINGDSDYWDLERPEEGAGDTIIGGPGRDFLYGEIGDDHVSGGPGKDYLYGEAGADTLVGGGDGDKLFGNAGEDVIKAGPGDDTARGNGGDDDVTGGGGDDTLSGDRGDDDIDGGAGTDTLVGGPGDDDMPEICGGDYVFDDDDDEDDGTSITEDEDAVDGDALRKLKAKDDLLA